MTSNKAVIFTKIPTSRIVAGEHISVGDVPNVDPAAAPPSGGLTLQPLHFAIDPYVRGSMREAHIKAPLPPFELGKPIWAAAIAKVLKADAAAAFKEGEVILGPLPVQQIVTLPGDSPLIWMARKLENPLRLDPKVFLGVLGMPGSTAYASLTGIGQPKKGETILVSAAAGAVGLTVGQLAKAEGLRVIGSVGSDAKADQIVRELGFDAAFNYKKEAPAAALARLAPEGIDIYYDNVGGDHLAAALDSLKKFGRVVACGMISQYNLLPEQQTPITNLMQAVAKSLTIRGFIVTDPDMAPKFEKEWIEKGSKLVQEGKIKAKTEEYRGIENGPKAVTSLFEGGSNYGKVVLTV